MNTTRMATCIVTMLFALFGCSKPAPTPERVSTAPAKEQATFVNRVWRVADSSSVAAGHLYVFLSEGTLVVAFANGKPTLGTWSAEGGALTMVEEGIAYKVDILELSKTEFRIRIHNPGEPVEIRFVSAEEASPPDRLDRP